jgi:protocatechuate 3,4-dioxygenase beta subunit
MSIGRGHEHRHRERHGDGEFDVRVTPSETVKPYPSLLDLIRSDIREDRDGTPLALTITVLNANANCSPLANAQVEIW